MKKINFTLQCTLFVLLSMGAFMPFSQAKIYYVKVKAAGLADGSSWTNAYPSLQAAIDVSAAGDSIAVASGVYVPDLKVKGTGDRNVAFYISKDIHLFGGFSGLSGTEGNFEIRNSVLHPTMLSGDIGVSGNVDDNAFHVVYIDHVSDRMWLQGFIITLGNTTGGSGLETYGSGIYNDADGGRSNPAIADCIIELNLGDQGGAGMVSYAATGGKANPTFFHCEFRSNNAGGGGGYMSYTDTEGVTNPVFTNCYFEGNTARSSQGSALSFIVHSSTAAPQLINCIVTGNHATTSSAMDVFVTGTGIASPVLINSVFAGNNNGSIRVSDIGTRISTLTVRNSIMWSNGFGHGLTVNGATEDVRYSIMQNSYPGEGNLSDDPQFVSTPSAQATPHTDGDVHIQSGSAAADAGDNASVPTGIVVDADGLPRFVDIHSGETGGKVDMGAFEIQEPTTSVSTVFHRMDWDVFPNPATQNLTVTLPQGDDQYECELFSTSGIRFIQKHVIKGSASLEIPVHEIPTGIYFISIMNGNESDVRKIIIAH